MPPSPPTKLFTFPSKAICWIYSFNRMLYHCHNMDIVLTSDDGHFFHPECEQPLRLPLSASQPFKREAKGDPALGALG